MTSSRYLAMFGLALGLAATGDAASAAPCRFSPSDQQWLSRSVSAWHVARTQLLGRRDSGPIQAIVFDQHCALRSQTAFNRTSGRWQASPISGPSLRVGDQDIPVGVFSAALADEKAQRFVMSTPTVWTAGKVAPGVLGLDRLMTAVLLHEATHLYQMRSYGARIGQLQARERIPDGDFDDDAIQRRFEHDKGFADSIARETALYLAAADAEDRPMVEALAREARAMTAARQAKYYVADQAYQREAEALWFTMEGSGQWVGYRWLRMPAARGGAGESRQRAMAGFGQRGRHWSQLQGLAMVLLVERLDPPGWRDHLFGSGGETAGQLIDRALR